LWQSVRAGIVDDPKDYRWCGYAAAVVGDAAARRGIGECSGIGQKATWRSVGVAYRKVLFGAGGEEIGGVMFYGPRKADGIRAPG